MPAYRCTQVGRISDLQLSIELTSDLAVNREEMHGVLECDAQITIRIASQKRSIVGKYPVERVSEAWCPKRQWKKKTMHIARGIEQAI